MKKITQLLDQYELKKVFSYCLIFSFITHLIAVIFSEGFHRPDEHLGIFRLMSYKLGNFPLDELSWEYPVMIRPWLQPGVFFLIAKPLGLVGITNPFFLAFILRFICSGIGFYSLFLLMRHDLNCPHKDERYKKILFISFALLWFIPFFHARTTAENLGISFMIFGLYPLLKAAEKKINYSWSNIPIKSLFFSGVMLGISFQLRFQMGIMIFFFMLWSVLFAQMRLKSISIVLFGIFTVAGIEILIDYWGYGEWTFSAWNYFYQNLVLKKAASFGSSPWYYYLKKTFEKGHPPFSLLLIIPSIIFFYKRPKHLFTWLVLPFFIIHSFIGHKELRFIFGLGLFVPFFIPFFFDFLQETPLVKWKKSLNTLLIIVIVENILLLIISIHRPAYSPISFYHHVFEKQEKINEIYTMRVFRDQLKFYLKNPIKEIVVEDRKKLEELIQSNNKTSWVLSNNISDIEFMDKIQRCEQDYLAYPKFVLRFKKLLKRSKIWSLYRCSSKASQ